MRLIALPLALAAATLLAAPAAAVTYDCSKAGNANKTACKGKVAAAKPAAVKVAVAKPAAPKVAAAKPAAQPRAPMTYDCSKAGNANKTACKGKTAAPNMAAVAQPAPAARHVAASNTNTVAWKTTTGKTVHYNCGKTGNKTKQACKN